MSYSHLDEDLRQELDAHLSALRQTEIIEVWWDGRIPPGGQIEPVIRQKMRDADVVVCLVTANYMNSDYCYRQELVDAISKSAAGEGVAIAVIGKACDWQITPLKHLKALPKDGMPLTSWPVRDEGLADVAAGIRLAIEAFRGQPIQAPALEELIQIGGAPVLTASVNPRDLLLERVELTHNAGASPDEAVADVIGATGRATGTGVDR
jgi:hypothetical protein